MGIWPMKSRGAAFNPLVIPRLRALRAMAESVNGDIDIQVAGGVNRGHVVDLVASGATTLALGTGLYRAENMAAEVSAIREAAEG
jgi:ribulose-phosphate 3-epimerase